MKAIWPAYGKNTAKLPVKSESGRGLPPAMSGLLGFLMEDCCAGKPEICAPLAALMSQPCGGYARTC